MWSLLELVADFIGVIFGEWRKWKWIHDPTLKGDPPREPDDKKPRKSKPETVPQVSLRRELTWLAGCAVAATALSAYANEYGYSTVPFFTLVIYVVVGFVRLLTFFIRRYAN